MKILQVDDNDDIIKLVSIMAESMGHEFHSANGGRKGLDMIIQNQYDLVLLDLSMPEFSGIDVINALSDKDLMDRQKIIVFSASIGTDDSMDKLQKKGVHSFLAKPIDIDQLMDKIGEIEQS